MHGIYLDNSTTTRPSEQSIACMYPYFTDKWGSPSAPHKPGQDLFPIIKESYRKIYKMLGADEEDSFVFTSSGAEAVNQVIYSAWLDIAIPTGKNHFITSSIDEAPAIMAMNRLERFGGVVKPVRPEKNGAVSVKAIIEAITPRTALISLSWGNGLTGVLNPVTEIAAICKERGIKLHLDVTHVLGKLYFNFKEFHPDFMTFNGDNIHAPKGTGGLYIKKNTLCSPLIIGGLEQGGCRAGALNVPALAALGCAAEEMSQARDFMCTEVARLRDYFEDEIIRNTPETVVFYRDDIRLPNITSIGFPGVTNEALLFYLNQKELYASIGGGNFQRIDLILTASGIEEKIAQSALNFSLSRETTEEEIEQAIRIIKESVSNLRKISGSLGK